MSYVSSLFRIALVLPAFAGFALASCGGTAVDPLDAPDKVVSGGECTNEGQQAPAADGCNTCACSSGSWSCTKRACPPEGTGGAPGTGGKPAASGGKPATGGVTGTGGKPATGGVTATGGTPATGGVTGTGGKPATGGVAGTGGTGPLCKPGPSPDGCNECTCVNGQLVCTDRACPEPACKDGETKFDGCNNCWCSAGAWACTRKACPPTTDGGAPKGCGGWLGNTCTAREYCAYLPGAYCGGADASATCKPRPTACDAVYSPVCGCDGNTYGNTCEAASKGTGVMSNGACR
jgi:hypothetical protein